MTQQLQTHDTSTELLPEQSRFEMQRLSPDTREIKGQITLNRELLDEILTAYLVPECQSVQLTVTGQKTPGCPRFIGQISLA